MTDPATSTPATEPADQPYEKRWLALTVIAATVLLIILDATVVNIALPAVPPTWTSTRCPAVDRHRLHADAWRLAPGRVDAPTSGPQAHLPGGHGRACGGVGPRRPGPERGHAVRRPRAPGRSLGAAGACASLALMTVLFTDAKERAKAFAVYGAIVAAARRWVCCSVGCSPSTPTGAGASGEPARRGHHHRRRHPAPAGEQGARRHELRRPRRRARHPGPGLVRLRLHAGGPDGAGERPAGGQRRQRDRATGAGLIIGGALLVAAFVVPRAAHAQPAAADANRARPQPRGRVPHVDLVGAASSGPSSSSASTSSRCCSTRRWRPLPRRCPPRWACSSRRVPRADWCPRSGRRPIMVLGGLLAAAACS